MTSVAQAVRQCTCVSCGECRGSGTVWLSFGSTSYGGGRYLGAGRCDDLDEPATCEECGGSGITEMCDYCQDLRDTDEH